MHLSRRAAPPRRYVLLDRDGTIIRDKHYLCDPRQVELLPGAGAGLRALQEAGFGLAVVTNQSGIGRGYYDEAAMRAVNAAMAGLLAAYRVRLDGIYFCPHAPEAACACRKPRPGLALAAARELGFDLRQSVVVGDKPCDVGLARAVGALGVLVAPAGLPEDWPGPVPDATAPDLERTAAWILAAVGLGAS